MGILCRVMFYLDKVPVSSNSDSKELEVVERQKYPRVCKNPAASGIIHVENLVKNMSQRFFLEDHTVCFL